MYLYIYLKYIHIYSYTCYGMIHFTIPWGCKTRNFKGLKQWGMMEFQGIYDGIGVWFVVPFPGWSGCVCVCDRTVITDRWCKIRPFFLRGPVGSYWVKIRPKHKPKPYCVGVTVVTFSVGKGAALRDELLPCAPAGFLAFAATLHHLQGGV